MTTQEYRARKYLELATAPYKEDWKPLWISLALVTMVLLGAIAFVPMAT